MIVLAGTCFESPEANTGAPLVVYTRGQLLRSDGRAERMGWPGRGSEARIDHEGRDRRSEALFCQRLVRSVVMPPPARTSVSSATRHSTPRRGPNPSGSQLYAGFGIDQQIHRGLPVPGVKIEPRGNALSRSRMRRHRSHSAGHSSRAGVR